MAVKLTLIKFDSLVTTSKISGLDKCVSQRSVQAWVDCWNTYFSDPDIVRYINDTTSFAGPNLRAINYIKNLNKPQT